MRIVAKFLRRSALSCEMPAFKECRRLHLSEKRIGGPMGWLILARDKRQFQGKRDKINKAPQMGKRMTFGEVVFKEASLTASIKHIRQVFSS